MKLVCPECQRENEPERIYCHDCGRRLDRSALAKEKPKEEDPKETHRRVTKMFNKSGVMVKARFFQGCKLLLAAVIVAAIVQMLRPPDVPEHPKTTSLASQINLDLENAALDPRTAPAQLRYSDDQVNAYLAYTLKSKQAVLSKYVQFERVIVAFEEGYAHFIEERSLFGFPLYVSASYGFSIQNGNIVAVNRGGHIGRMPIHPALMQFGSILFSDVAGALERERKSISKLSSVEFQPKTIILTPKQPPQM